jgi:hypothetical protein
MTTPSSIWAHVEGAASGTFSTSDEKGGVLFIQAADQVAIAEHNAMNEIDADHDRFNSAVNAIYFAGFKKGCKDGLLRGERIGRNHLNVSSFFVFWLVTLVLSMITGVVMGMSIAQMQP